MEKKNCVSSEPNSQEQHLSCILSRPFDRDLKLRGWVTTVNKPLPTNWSDREKTYSELSVSLGQVPILEMGVRRGVSSGSDEQVGSTSRSTVAQTNTDQDEMEEVVDEEEDVEGEGASEGEGEGDVEGDEEEGEEEEEWVEEEEVEEESDSVRDLLSTHSVWVRM